MRKRYRWNPATCQQELISESEGMNSGIMIMPDIEDFVSPIDGRVVHGRRGLREHNKEHGVTNMADFTNEWKDKAKERAKAFTPGAGYDKQRRIERLKENYDKLSRGRKS